MNAADSSCLTCTKEIDSCRVRRASMIPLMPSPGSPKITCTPQSIRRSASTSAAVRAICVLLCRTRKQDEGPAVDEDVSKTVSDELDTPSGEEYFLAMESPPRDERATSMS